MKRWLGYMTPNGPHITGSLTDLTTPLDLTIDPFYDWFEVLAETREQALVLIEQAYKNLMEVCASK